MLRYQYKFNPFIYLFLVPAAIFSSCASSKFKVDNRPLMKHLQHNAVFKESHTGLLIVDIDKNKVLFDYNSDKHFTPASNTKLLTYYAALKMIGDSIPSLEYCQSNDTLYFRGTGDPTLLYQNFRYANTMDFLTKTNKPLVYIPKPIEDHRLGPGWSWDDYPYYFSAEKSGFPIYGNMVHFKKVAEHANIQVIPAHFKSNLNVSQDALINDFTLARSEFKNDFELKFSGKTLEFEDEIPFIYSDSLFVQLLSDTLHKPVELARHFPTCKTDHHYAVPTDSVSKHILIESDNFLAEHMLLLLSNQYGDTLSSKNAIHFMMENFLGEYNDEIYWVDGSGLSRYNMLTPSSLVAILRYIYQDVPKEKLYTMLPEASSSGTLKHSFNELSGKIHAKTGSMTHVYNLSGYMETNSGKTLLFSFMNNNFNASFSELKYEMEKVLSVFIND